LYAGGKASLEQDIENKKLFGKFTAGKDVLSAMKTSQAKENLVEFADRKAERNFEAGV
jgi:hypothetical protein